MNWGKWQRRFGTRVRALRRAWRRVGRGKGNTRPVFVVGCQRSGTGMTLRVFERSLEASVFWESDRRAFTKEGLRLRALPEVARMVRWSRTTVAVFKAMNDLQRSREFLEDWPRLRIVWLYRTYEDVVNSCVRKFSTMKESLRRVAEDPAQAGWWGENVEGELLTVVREYYSD